MAEEKKNLRNSSMDIVKFILSLIVLGYHICTEQLGRTAVIARVFEAPARFAVAFFLASSGYFFVKNLLKNQASSRKSIQCGIVIYVRWSVIYILLSIVVNVVIQGEPFLGALLRYVKYFFFVGSYWHLWYMVSFLYAMILVYIIYRFFKETGLKILLFISVLLFGFGALYYGYPWILETIPVFADLHTMPWFFVCVEICCLGIPCFVGGYSVALFENSHQMKKTKYTMLMILTVIIYVIEFAILVHLNLKTSVRSQFTTRIVSLCMLMFLLHFPLPSMEKTGKWCRGMYAYIYFAHPLFMEIVGKGCEILHLELPVLVYGIAVFLLTLFSGMILQYLKERRCKKSER